MRPAILKTDNPLQPLPWTIRRPDQTRRTRLIAGPGASDRSQAAGPGIHVVDRPDDPVVCAGAHALSRSGWAIEVICPSRPDAVNALVADIWDAGGRIVARLDDGGVTLGPVPGPPR